MSDAYAILDLLDEYGKDVRKALWESDNPDCLYAFSDIRENLLEWFPFEPGARLLQIGSGYGALTGLFLNRGLKVTVLEPDDVEVVIGKRRFEEWNPDEIRTGCYEGDKVLCYAHMMPAEFDGTGFDYVVMAGSLEQAPDWYGSLYPYQDLLEKARQALKPGGSLILAADNRLALRYMAGKEKKIRGFSKQELEKMLGQSGEGSVQWFYPLPDYRLPSVLYSDRFLPKSGELSQLSTAYDEPRYRLFSEEAWLEMLGEEGQFVNFTSSYLVIYRK